MSNETHTLDIRGLQRLLPHRYPMLLVDKIVEIVPNERAVGQKSVTINEHFFSGHFPGYPVMPGVLVVEALAQTAAALVMHGLKEIAPDKIVYFMTIDNAKFRRPVHPGDTLMLEVEKQHARGQVWKFRGRAVVDDATAAEATFCAMIADRP